MGAPLRIGRLFIIRSTPGLSSRAVGRLRTEASAAPRSTLLRQSGQLAPRRRYPAAIGLVHGNVVVLQNLPGRALQSRSGLDEIALGYDLRRLRLRHVGLILNDEKSRR